MTAIYVLVAALATLVGSLTGMGGGIIIKPVMDMISNFTVDTIGVVSSITVLAMSIVSIAKYFFRGEKLPLDIVIPIALGSTVGGLIGQNLLRITGEWIPMGSLRLLQNLMLVGLLLIVFFYMKKRPVFGKLPAQIIPVSIAVGILLGLLSSFIGIGGGPINIVAFLYIFSFDIKVASIASLISILFSQVAKLMAILLGPGFSGYNLSIVPYMVVAAVLGAQLGGILSRKLKGSTIERLFMVMQYIIMGMALYNIFLRSGS